MDTKPVLNHYKSAPYLEPPNNVKDFENLLFEVENDTMLSEKILMMYHKTSEGRALLGKELRDYSEAHFSLNSFISAHETLYFKLARNH